MRLLVQENLSANHHAFWRLGFRPFFLLGASQALIAILVWVIYLAGGMTWSAYFEPVQWHSHEMIYGFVCAIIAGFVLTAVQNWTGRRGVHGWRLQVLVLLWGLGRIFVALPIVPPILVAAVDLSFLPAVAASLYPYLKSRDMRSERFLFVVLALLFAGNLLMHLQVLGGWTNYPRSAALLGLDAIIWLLVFIGGRVIPFFTESSIAKAQPRTRQWVEVLSHGSAGAFLLADFALPMTKTLAACAFFAALIHFIRLLGWQVRRVRRVPLIWILHLGYLWLVIGFALAGLAALGLLAQSHALHAFTIGALGSLIYGMISRVSLGHTGRRLHPRCLVVAGYALLSFAALIRIAGPVIAPKFYLGELFASGALWVIAFLFFLIVYFPILTGKRVDGRDG